MHLDQKNEKTPDSNQEQVQEEQKGDTGKKQKCSVNTQTENKSNLTNNNNQTQQQQQANDQANKVNQAQQTIQEENKEPIFIKPAYVIGISGGILAGKGLLTDTIKQKFEHYGLKVNIIRQIDFYKKRPKEVQDIENYLIKTDFDSPEAFEMDKFADTIKRNMQLEEVEIPIFDIQKEDIELSSKKLQKCDLILVQGTLIFSEEKIKNLIQIKIFLETDEDIRLSRLVYRQVCIKKRDLEKVIDKYLLNTKQAYEKFTLPSKKHADIIIPNYGGGYCADQVEDNFHAGFASEANIAIDFVTYQVNQIIQNKKKDELLKIQNQTKQQQSNQQQQQQKIQNNNNQKI